MAEIHRNFTGPTKPPIMSGNNGEGFKPSYSADQKALFINLDPNIYGTFAEIGAGQEVSRHFFRSGGASGTVAKAMSAYDKLFSDAIYGKEPDGRYVTENRLIKMLDHEYQLILDRLEHSAFPDRKYFAFANTVATINFAKTFKGQGWMGMRFQSAHGAEPNIIYFHVRLHENEAKLQQETIGEMGVNLIYACFYCNSDPSKILESLYDNISKDAIEIDMIHMSGPDFEKVDNRLLSLELVRRGFTNAVAFGPEGNNLLPADLLYKKNILAIRGRFRPVTKVNMDMIQKGYKAFIKDPRVSRDKVVVLFEITLNNLLAEGEINERDFLDRAEVLCSLGQTVLISNYQEYYKLVHYFSQFSKLRMGLILGVTNLQEIFNEKYYRGLAGGILEATGIIFSKDIKMFVYPSQPKKSAPLLNTQTMKVHPRLRALYDYLMFNGKIKDIEDFDQEILQIFSPNVLEMIGNGEDGWESYLPEMVDRIIKEKKLFGYHSETAEANS
jgi:hypothetical protein